MLRRISGDRRRELYAEPEARAVGWLLRLGGAQTDKMEGIQKLQLTAEKGRYVRPYAQLLLAVAALRDHKPDQAKELLRSLAGEFPRNPLHGQELARLQ